MICPKTPHSYSSRTLQINLKIILFTLALLRAHVSNSDTERGVCCDDDSEIYFRLENILTTKM